MAAFFCFIIFTKPLAIYTPGSPIDAELHLVTIVGVGCGLLGVPPFIVLCINLVDRSWAGFLHLSDLCPEMDGVADNVGMRDQVKVLNP